MPGKGKAITRPYLSEERAAIEQGAEALGLSAHHALAQLGDQAMDVYLNDVAYWRCVPVGVWSYTIGGYQVMKKSLSYRERGLLGRDLKPEEVREWPTRSAEKDHTEPRPAHVVPEHGRSANQRKCVYLPSTAVWGRCKGMGFELSILPAIRGSTVRVCHCLFAS